MARLSPRAARCSCKEEYRRKEGYEARYDELLKENKLLFTCDLIKETLTLAYGRVDETLMMKDIEKVMDLSAKRLGMFISCGSTDCCPNTSKALLPMQLTTCPPVKSRASTTGSRRSGVRGTGIQMTITSSSSSLT